MKTLLMCLLLSLSLNSRGQDLENEENKYLSFIYQQDGYKLDDPKGDVLLLWSAQQIPESIKSFFKGNNRELTATRQKKIQELLLKYPQYSPKSQEQLIVDKTYFPYRPDDVAISMEGHEAPFKVKRLVQMFKAVITKEYQQNGTEPKAGKIHDWSPSIKKELKKKFLVFSRMSKLLLALSRGGSSYYLVTGAEEELRSYILSKEKDSINLREMFQASYRINHGDVYLSLLTVENILSRSWTSTQRDQLLLTTKLKNISNFNYATDKFGAWYHLFGIMLYGYAEGSLKAKIVGNIETIGSQLMGKFQDERQETYINARGGPAGGSLRKFIDKKEYLEFEWKEKFFDENYYMDLNEDFSKRLKKKAQS